MQKQILRLKRHDWFMKGLSSLIAGILRFIADRLENRNKQDDHVDLMADVDDQRAHHFGSQDDFAELDDSV